MEVLSRKLSVISAIVAFAVTLVVGFMAGVSWDVTLLRGCFLFVLVMVVSLILFGLALKDSPENSKEE